MGRQQYPQHIQQGNKIVVFSSFSHKITTTHIYTYTLNNIHILVSLVIYVYNIIKPIT